MGFILEGFKLLCFAIDAIVYGFISTVYGVFMYIARAQLFSNDVIQAFYDRIFLLLGIFMIFKLLFSLLKMLVQPDLMTDSKQGVGKIISRIAVSIAMLTTVNLAFEWMYELQNIIIEDNILAKIFLAPVMVDSKEVSTESININDMGYEMSITCFSSFFLNNPKVPESTETVATITNNGRDMWALWDRVNKKDANKEYYFNYLYIISTAVGIILCLLLINFCIDLGVRMVKLAFLQLIAPIPIISYMEPNDKIFKNWLSLVAKTYADVFIRLIAVYFGLFIISQVSASVLT